MQLPVRKIVCHVMLPLVAGFIIYLEARPSNWLDQTIFPSNFSFLSKNGDIHSTGWVTRWIVFSGPDFCWSYSLSSALLFWNYFSGFKRSYFPAMILVLILMQEIVQLFVSAFFTFDILDMIAAVLAFLLSVFLNRNYV